MTNEFCPDCEKILIRRTDSQSVVRYCAGCDKEYEGTDTDTLIMSDIENISGYNEDVILKYAPYDRVNTVVKTDCSGKKCSRKYMYKVFMSNLGTGEKIEKGRVSIIK